MRTPVAVCDPTIDHGDGRFSQRRRPIEVEPRAVAGCVITVDDQACVRRALRSLVEATSALDLVGEAESGEAAVALVPELEPDLVLMDVRMPGLGGIAATRAIKAMRPDTLVFLISATHPDELPRAASECSADLILWKGELRPALVDEIWARHCRGERAASGRPSSQ
jgi:DNA-binding NarL/FixJ family response regulator